MYTHNIEIKNAMVDIQGEIAFDNGNPQINIPSNFEVSSDCLGVINELFRVLLTMTKTCGEITKVKIVKKP